ncbi:SAM-dependent methyltransferase [Streptomyces sp. ST2-7A]|uniref:SAM-dependent methyltransferase n=1 Tax=Streptomyces sp. ST2-7A TaxID=2907214 RepID=UPI001F39BA3D|nr:SAM-dependent methyltransferase [Streptomyces sp. ST2-7A]MCE7083351.1 SAM-dependent methyltransferase [Streptomyces sp. ST2-7A]
MTATDWIPQGIDRAEPSAARAYDYLLGGPHHFEADRQLAEKVLTVLPARTMSRQNREFLHRVVAFLAGEGITQYLDLGSGLPTLGNVHEAAQRADAASRVVYVDNEDAAVAHGRCLLGDSTNTVMLQADVREPQSVLDASPTRQLIDFSQPVALLMLGVTQFLHDADEPRELIRRYREALAPGSCLAIASFTWDNDPDTMRRTVEMFKESGRTPIVPRTRAEVLDFLGDFELVDPGLVYAPQWRPDQPDAPAARSNLYAGVARKP